MTLDYDPQGLCLQFVTQRGQRRVRMAKRGGGDLGCCVAYFLGAAEGALPARRFFISMATGYGDLYSGVIVRAAMSFFLHLPTWMKSREPPYGGVGVNVCMCDSVLVL